VKDKSVGLAVTCLMLMFLAGCAARQTVVLVPDRDGRIGQAEVSTAGGKQLLTKSGDMTRIISPTAPPSAVTTADPAYLVTTFGEVLGVEPVPPERFTIYFKTGTTTLRAESQMTIPAIVAAIKQRAAINIFISGHTDATDADQANEKLSLARTEQVRELLLQQGVELQLMTLSFHGEGNPAVPTPDGVAEPRNRRVEVIVQ